jgi:hypothetical protein
MCVWRVGGWLGLLGAWRLACQGAQTRACVRQRESCVARQGVRGCAPSHHAACCWGSVDRRLVTGHTCPPIGALHAACATRARTHARTAWRARAWRRVGEQAAHKLGWVCREHAADVAVVPLMVCGLHDERPRHARLLLVCACARARARACVRVCVCVCVFSRGGGWKQVESKHGGWVKPTCTTLCRAGLLVCGVMDARERLCDAWVPHTRHTHPTHPTHLHGLQQHLRVARHGRLASCCLAAQHLALQGLMCGRDSHSARTVRGVLQHACAARALAVRVHAVCVECAELLMQPAAWPERACAVAR